MHKMITLAAFGLTLSLSANAQTQRYDKEKVRANLLTRVLVPQKVTLKGELPKDEHKRKFIEMYLNEIHPGLQDSTIVDQIASIFHLLLDSGSENSPQEKQSWKDKYNEYVSKSTFYQVDPVWINKVLAWGKLAEGLEGDLPDFAKRLAKLTELNQFPEDMKPVLDDIYKKLMEYQDAVTNTEASKHLTEYRKGMADTIRQFKAGEISFAQAQEKINGLVTRMGYRYVGAEAVKTHGHLLNEMAVLRSQLAKSKGYKTWTAYQLEATGQGYTPEYRGPEQQRRFLEKWLAQSVPVNRAYYERRIKELGLEGRRDTLRSQHASLLTPEDLALAQPYFPPEKISDIWENAMLNSGFDPKMMKPIILDDLPRPGKNGTNAYMSGTIIPEATHRELDPETLSFKDIGPDTEGLIYVLQSFRGAGLDELRTGLHELTGHAFEYLNKRADLSTGDGYGYVETPSMTAELFMENAQFLHDNAVAVDGQKPSVAQFQKWLDNSKAAEALGATFRASSALYDINIWDYDYDQPGAKTYVERVFEVAGDIDKRTEVFPDVEAPVPLDYFWVSTSHFISGNVRNIGYTYASVSVEMMAEYISRRLKEETGNANWSNNPKYADILINEWYKKGWKDLYPTNIEKITGQPYDVEAILKKMLAPLLTCETLVAN